MNLKNKNLIIVVLVIVCGLLAGGLFYSQFGFPAKKSAKLLTAEEAAKIGIDYINENLLSSDIKASLAGAPVEEQNLYKFKIKIQEQEFFSYITKDGKILFPQAIDLEKSSPAKTAETEASSAIGNFSESGAEVCQEGDKPIVYFFGSQGCPHCVWEHPIIEEVAEQFGDYISFHNNMDSDADMDVFSQYSTGGIPTLVLGCKYYRVGSGERAGEVEEAKVLTTLICDLTNGQPTDVCKD